MKAVVYDADPNAFLVVNPTEEVLGGGFGDLRPKWRKKMTKKPDKDSERSE